MMSEPVPSGRQLDAATDKFWHRPRLEDVMSGIEAWQPDEQTSVDVADDEWDAFLKALAE